MSALTSASGTDAEWTIPPSVSLATLAKAAADTMVVSVDPGAKQAALSYWHRGRDAVTAVPETLPHVDDAEVRRLAGRLLDQSAEPDAYWRLREALEAHADHRISLSGLFTAAWRAECHSRLGYHLGVFYNS
jgi:hypothetical protein